MGWSHVSNQATPAAFVGLPSSVSPFPFDPRSCTPSRPQTSISHNHRTLHFPEQFWQLRAEVSLTEGHWGDCLSEFTKFVYFANLIDSSIFLLRFLIFVFFKKMSALSAHMHFRGIVDYTQKLKKYVLMANP